MKRGTHPGFSGHFVHISCDVDCMTKQTFTLTQVWAILDNVPCKGGNIGGVVSIKGPPQANSSKPQNWDHGIGVGCSVKTSCDKNRAWRVSQRQSHCLNKKQCSRQLQCEVPCSIGNVANSSLFINSSLSSTNHAVWMGGLRGSSRRVWLQGGLARGGGDILVQLPYTALPHGASPQRDFAQQHR